jgi:hypothetical protein
MTSCTSFDSAKRTYITPSQEIEQRERLGFHSVERYASIIPEKNELGSIAELTGKHEQIWPGMWREEVIIHERIFIVAPGDDRERHKPQAPNVGP